MATKTCFFFVTLICCAVSNPLGQTTVCDTQNLLPGLLQGLPNIATTVCDPTPNLFGLGLGLGGLNLQLPFLQSYLNALGSTTLLEAIPNVGKNPLAGLEINPLGGSTTVCESTNQGFGLGGLAPVLPPSTTVIENTPNLGLGLGYLGLPSLGGQTTLVESTPNIGVGLPYGLPLLSALGGLFPGLGLQGLGIGYPSAIPFGRLPGVPINPMLLNGLPVSALSQLGVL